MLTFTLAIFCLTTSNLPWFMDLTFQVPMQYCSLQHQTLLLSPVTSTAGYSFCFGSIPSFFLELFLHWSPVAYWAPTDLGSFSFSILSFCLFILFMWPPYCPLKMPGSLLPWNLCNVPLEGVLFSMLSIYLNPFTYIKAQISPFQWSLSELAYFILQLAQPYSICLPLLCFL